MASLAPLRPSEIPDDVRIVGSNVSFKEAADAMTAVSGKNIEQKEVEIGLFKAKTTVKPKEIQLRLFDL